ncbi:hypothetical protein [Pseudomonas mandelii]|uniref:hypothetical protein n=1 Tax=Pseudomonas mandelii TaxID=75612 RepID=UPI00112D9C2D|nr:hypothetical protein [Pseudomonas mandelii]
MAKLKAVWTLIGVLALCFVLTLGYSVTRYNELQKDNLQTLEESRRYTDSRIIESQQSTLAAISDVSKTTTLLTRILCQTQFDRNECERELGPLSRNN